MKDAQQWEAEAKKQRESAARDRLAAAITVDTAEATAEDLIRNHAGDARAFPSFVDRGSDSWRAVPQSLSFART